MFLVSGWFTLVRSLETSRIVNLHSIIAKECGFTIISYQTHFNAAISLINGIFYALFLLTTQGMRCPRRPAYRTYITATCFNNFLAKTHSNRKQQNASYFKANHLNAQANIPRTYFEFPQHTPCKS